MNTRAMPVDCDNAILWEAFNLWADTHSLPREEEDWLPWWECFQSGADAGAAVAA